MNKSVLKKIKFNNFFNLSKKYIGQGAIYQNNTSDVKLKGKFLKCKRPDMPTLVFLPELMEPIENYENFFNNPNHHILQYRNVWLLSPRNFGDSDHHKSFDLEEMADDVKRFIDDKKLSIVTIGGHGYGAKIACAFSTMNLDRTSGVMCIEGGPIDHSFHPWWLECKDAINSAYKISKETNSIGEFYRKLDKAVTHSKWNKIIKQNAYESGNGINFKFNIEDLVFTIRKTQSEITNFTSRYGLFPGRAFVSFASESHFIYLATNTIPFYTFFPKLEGKFPSTELNFIQTENDNLSELI
jgi:pimeloyl-ACP methyl ester carboxylesterase